jgi:hypothetical protein
MIEMKLEGKILLNDTKGKRCILLLDCVVYRNKQETGRVNLESRVVDGEIYEKIQDESFREKYMQDWIATLDKQLCDTIMKMQERSNADKEKRDGK